MVDRGQIPDNPEEEKRFEFDGKEGFVELSELGDRMEAQSSTSSMRSIVDEILICPLSKEMMTDPVISILSGQTYDRASI